jgi:circadian clock protein KaiC
VCGGPGCGKTIFATEFLLRGALEHGEPGLFISFEETPGDLRKNVAAFGFDVDRLIEKKLFAIDYVRVERSEIEESGEYDLDGLFIRIGYALDSISAKRVVLDTIEALFSGLSNLAILRAELRRLFGWLKERGVTVVITGEKGEQTLTRQGLEEYVSDCVVLLDHRIHGGVSTRRLRVVKYRGSTHGTNEYPFLIGEQGVSVLPITSVGLQHRASNERVGTGVERLDAMLGGGYFRGSSILVTGTAGSGKSSLAAHFVHATCKRGERCLYLAFEESPEQIIRNMRSIGIDLRAPLEKGLLRIDAARPSLHGLETHLAVIHKAVTDFAPSAVVFDPVTNLVQAGSSGDVQLLLVRILDFLKGRGVTAFLTSLTPGDAAAEASDVGVSSLMDTWLLLRNLESAGERNRGLYVLKSRGMAHSNQIREFLLTSHGIQLIDVYVGSEGILTGAARIAQAAKEAAAQAEQVREMDDQERRFERRRAVLSAQIEALRAELENETLELERARAEQKRRRDASEGLRTELASYRGMDGVGKQVVRPIRSRKRNGRKEVGQ